MIALDTLIKKKQQLGNFADLPVDLRHNLEQWLKIELTYTSNALEGNTLSRAETALVVEKGITVEGKTLVEHLEATSHALAFEMVLDLAKNSNQPIDEHVILDIHRLILAKIDENNAGRYRRVPVRIAGSTVIMPNPVKVPDLMVEFTNWLNEQTGKLHPVDLASHAHYKLVSIHPFVDGNGRTARLLMNLILMQAGFPPAIISNKIRKRYLDCLESAQLGGSLDNFLQLIYEAVDQSLEMCLESKKRVM